MATVKTDIGYIKGAQGPKGDKGEKGSKGDAGTIKVGTVATAQYGTPASVRNSGTSTDAVLDFIIPQGQKGEETTDAANLNVSAIVSNETEFPTFTAGEAMKSILGKISKFLSDLKAKAEKNSTDISSINNNLAYKVTVVQANIAFADGGTGYYTDSAIHSSTTILCLPVYADGTRFIFCKLVEEGKATIYAMSFANNKNPSWIHAETISVTMVLIDKTTWH